jgi:hypothetical protein
VARLTAQQIFPAYLKLPPLERPPSDLKLLAGSRLKVVVTANTGLTKALLRLAGVNQEVPLQIDAKTPQNAFGEFEIPPKDLTGFSVRLTDAAGVESGEGATYRIDLVPDQLPTIKITYPSRPEELATTAATVLIAFEGQDDFGISKATLHYKLGTNPEKTIGFDLGGQGGKTLQRRFDWKLPTLDPRPQIGQALEYWLTIEDNNTATGPGGGTTEHYQVRIVTEEEKRLEFANRFSDTIGGLSEVATTQDDLNKRLGEAIFAKPANQPPNP